MPIAPALDLSSIAMDGFSALIWTAGTIAVFVLALLFTLDAGRARRRHGRPRVSQPHARGFSPRMRP